MGMRDEGQAILFAVGDCNSGLILAALGDRARVECDGRDLGDLFDGDDLPGKPGIYAWEGAITLWYEGDPETGEKTGVAVEFDGEVRPAVLGDFGRFGLPTPTPRLPEGAAP